jgi:hypothetical protein
VLTPSPGYSGVVTTTVDSFSNGLTASFAAGGQTQGVTLTGGLSRSLQVNLAAPDSGKPAPIGAAGCPTGCGIHTTTNDGITPKPQTTAIIVNPPDPLTADITISGSRDPNTGNYPLGLPIYFTWSNSNGAVGSETFR